MLVLRQFPPVIKFAMCRHGIDSQIIIHAGVKYSFECHALVLELGHFCILDQVYLLMDKFYRHVIKQLLAHGGMD